ncbi:MAG: hypothetical protein COX62_01810 [Deltaproteobacteria bacterium CG_4_10_14_0_2_um_filter_43_8]|nr:MAG: hypothetical protein COV43_03180 [Deltaproteobacteria bacterium CG11_big_fil_rev_8_21_14_0_20_42_23]PJA21652.1 MAG: hypothetical protein COX62_01810 [Deltaproteobacteria bacterium CG_4_10_14_0_2_um_filter_43_8]PJC63780.1 MAG: hypothetical protein CO021_07795 [Deltaproteobacteria bacterium CG_4_9_14_0_2_um_filter_42_21]
MAKIKICKFKDCLDAATTEGYCRLHYLVLWRKLKEKKKKSAAKKLNQYVEYMMKGNPGKYVDAIKKDIRSDKFEETVARKFGSEEDKDQSFFDEPGYDEEVDSLLQKMKIEKTF